MWLRSMEDCSSYSENCSFKEWEYCAYFPCHFVMFLCKIKVIFVYMVCVTELYVELF
jgi:Zn-finger protein